MMDSIASSRKKNLEGQLGLFSLLEDDAPSSKMAIPHKEEYSKAELMAMEKETTGIYLSGHPMDDYRKYLKNTHVLPIGELMGEDCPLKDEDVVSVAGIIQVVKNKTTRNNSMMAYVTLEDDTASIELIVFSRTLVESGSYIKENGAVVVTGRLSLRDDKEPQIIANRVRPMTDFSEAPKKPEAPQAAPQNQTLYLRLPGEAGKLYPKTKAILNMFPGQNRVVLYFADTKLRRGTVCCLRENMVKELENVLGQENVVLK